MVVKIKDDGLIFSICIVQTDYLDLLKPSNKRKITSDEIGGKTELKKVRNVFFFIKQSDPRSELKCVLFYFLLLFIHFHLLKILLSIYKIDKYNRLKYFFNCQAKIETRALKAKRPGFTDERYNETSYFFENGSCIHTYYVIQYTQYLLYFLFI